MLNYIKKVKSQTNLNKYYPIIISLLFTCSACNNKKNTKSDIDIEFAQDTLEVGYTYWWPESGPFIGQCGEELALVFSGTITEIMPTTDEAGPLYNSQKGYIHINQVYKIKDLAHNTYANQQFFVSDCFDGLNLKKDDQVLVFCYDYENDLSIPGNKSILKIDSFDDPLISSIKKYIDADQNALKLTKDLQLWKKVGLDENLSQIIECAKESR